VGVGVGTLPFDGEARKLHLNVLRDITTERERQDAKWGQQNHADIDENCLDIIDLPLSFQIKRENDKRAKEGKLTWAHIALEEVLEAFEESNPIKRREELVQCAAVFTAWIECLDKKASKK
jgi:hypothetical protein